MEEQQSATLLGQLLLASGAVTPEEVRAALRRQQRSEQPLGEILIGMGALAPRQLERALQTQARLRGNPGQPRPFVLVVDDDLEVCALVGDVLTGAGYRVGVAQNEAEAVAALLACDAVLPSLIVLDLGLPRYGGVELLTMLRKSEPTRELPVVVLTGHPDKESAIRERGLEISEFLAKPVPLRKLVQVVETALLEARTPASQAAG